MVYLFILALLFYFFFRSSKIDLRMQYCSVMSTLLIFFSGFRNIWIGNDTFAYLNSMERSTLTQWSELFQQFFPRYFSPSYEIGKDPGFYVFEKLFSSLSINHTLYLLLVAAFVIIPISYFIYKNTNNLTQILFAYLYYIVMFFTYVPNSAIRQSLAIGIAHFAYILLQKDKIIFSILVIFIASTFHKTALICLPFFVLVKYTKITNTKIITIIGFLMVYLLGSSVTSLLTGFGDIYDGYAKDYFLESGKSRPFLVLILVFLLYLITFLANFSKEQKEHMKLFIIGSSMMMLIVPLVRVDPSYLRLTAYFGMIFVIYISEAINQIRFRYKFIYPILIVIFILKGIMDDNYKFNWQYMKVNERYAYEINKSETNFKLDYKLCQQKGK